MSSHTVPASSGGPSLTAGAIRSAKGARRLAVVTAYDYPSALMVDAAGVDVVLVGDSLGMVMLGRKDTAEVTLDEMVHHCRAVTAGTRSALVVGDMPFLTYETGVRDALLTAKALVQRGGVRAVKLEGGRPMVPQVKALVECGIPVMGHVGLTPQRSAVLGGFKVQGKTAEAARAILEDAQALEDAGCFSVVLEAVPAPVAALVTGKLRIPTIGIGAGPHCDGQVLVLHDMLGLTQGHVPRFVKQYADLAAQGRDAVMRYAEEVRSGVFPAPEHGFAMPVEEEERLRREIF